VKKSEVFVVTDQDHHFFSGKTVSMFYLPVGSFFRVHSMPGPFYCWDFHETKMVKLESDSAYTYPISSKLEVHDPSGFKITLASIMTEFEAFNHVVLYTYCPLKSISLTHLGIMGTDKECLSQNSWPERIETHPVLDLARQALL